MFIENALSFCFVAFSSRELESTSLEKALEHDNKKWIPVFVKNRSKTKI
jgi:hypothetical protein